MRGRTVAIAHAAIYRVIYNAAFLKKGRGMYLLFLDESGTPPKSGKAAGRYLVIGGIIIPEARGAALRLISEKLSRPQK